MASKILPYRPGQEDEDGFIRASQEEAIRRTEHEFLNGTGAALWGSDMDTGKTLCAAEVVKDMGLDYVLIIGVKDTYAQWAERLDLQTDGAIKLRRMNATKVGQANLEAFLAGTPGIYFTGSQYLTAQDWEYRPIFYDAYDKTTFKDTGRPVWKRTSKAKGEELILRELAGIGPWAMPTQKTERVHKFLFKKKLAKRPLDLLIFDEIHMIANRKAIGRRTLASVPWKLFLGMSGTWMGNKFENAWSIARIGWPDRIERSFEAWRGEWCETKNPKRSGGLAVTDGRGNAVQIVTGQKPGLDFVKTLPCYIRLESPIGPPPEPELVHVELLPRQRQIYDSFEADSMAWLNAHPGLEPVIANIPVVNRIRMRQVTLGEVSVNEAGEVHFATDAMSTKFCALRGVLDRPRWKGRIAAIFVGDSKEFAHVLAQQLTDAGYPATIWSGDVSSKKRDQIKEQFLAREIPYLVATVPSFSTGLDGFQKVCNRVAWVSESDNNMLNNQGIKRWWRSGDDEMLADFEHVKIVANDTLDLGIFGKNRAETTTMSHTLAA